ncbi:MAG TPA: sulfurtransferase TusA family protein [Trebonia sp.]|nr:sulfurtransferase TusA family protein [Trebonia sp.]
MTWFGRRGNGTASEEAPPLRTEELSAAPEPQPVRTIDALGRKCPIPIIMLAEQIRDVPVGAVIAVLADDPAAYSDVPAWCTMKSHECVFRSDLPSGWAFGIRRRY